MDSANSHTVRIGIPFRTLEEERTLLGRSRKIEFYSRAVRNAGAEPVLVSLALDPAARNRLAESLDGFVLTGSPADVDPTRYGAPRHPKTAAADAARELTDDALLDHAITAGKPVLAICYGNQLLNVHFCGSLVQDIPSVIAPHLQHEKAEGETRDPEHPVYLDPGSRLAALAGAFDARINSSHHQSIRRPGRNLRVVAHAPDGVIEAVEWIGDSNWIVGVQWHPERMEGDAFSAALFRDLIAAARQAVVKD